MMQKQNEFLSAKKIAIPQGIHVMAKPAGSRCNLNCTYCFYLEKEHVLHHAKTSMLMPDDVLEAYIKNYISSQATPETEFVWHGGEPLICGLDFFKKAVKLQKKYARGKKIINSVQTNGILLTDDFCGFFKENNFIVGLSIDGPEEIHDKYRAQINGAGSFRYGMDALKLLQKHANQYNVLACVTKESCERPLDIYHFFKENGVEFIQFTPLVERCPDAAEKESGYRLAHPFKADKAEENDPVTEWSVDPIEYGDFLIRMFDEWVRNDVGRIFVNVFESALAQWVGNPAPSCHHARQCGRSVIVEHDGNVFACDHCVYPEYKLGNLKEKSLSEMIRGNITNFGSAKESTLTKECRMCRFIQLCFGGCPKQRFAVSVFGEKGQHYLCPSYKKFFNHIPKYMTAMQQLLSEGYPASYIMQAIDKPLVLVKKP